MSQMQLRWTDAAGQQCQIDLRDKVFVGRVCAGIDPSRAIILDDANVSRDHAVFVVHADGVTLRDSSRNGTWVNGIRVTQGGERRLSDGDVVRIGATEIALSVAKPSERTLAGRPADRTPRYTVAMTVSQVVTHLVADVRGFTTLSENLPSDKMYELMSAVIHTFSDIVVAHHGTIKDYAGDAVYAFWEHGDRPKPERAEQACRAALAQLAAVPTIVAGLRDAVPEVSALKIGWGITTGLVTVSQYGARSADLAVLGDSTNLAFRFSALANKDVPAPVVLCEATQKLVADSFSLVSLGAHPIKGKAKDVPLFGLSGVSDAG